MCLRFKGRQALETVHVEVKCSFLDRETSGGILSEGLMAFGSEAWPIGEAIKNSGEEEVVR